MEESMKDFEKELSNSFRVLKIGEILDGMIVDIDDAGVTCDIGYYTQGVSPLDAISDDPDFNALRDLKIGDSCKVMVVDLDDGKGNVQLSMKEAREAEAWDKIQKIFENREIVSVHIKAKVPSGVITYLEGIKAFIPASQLAMEYVEDTSEYVGKTLNVRVMSADKNAKKLTLSAKAVLREKEELGKQKKIQAIVPGSVFEGTVERMETYGAFILLDNGLTGLLHISQICEKRINKPSEILKLEQKVKVKVLKVDGGKISLTMKDVEGKTQETDVTDTDDNEEENNSYSEEMTNTPFAALFSKLGINKE